jgi:hypothetical protein
MFLKGVEAHQGTGHFADMTPSAASGWRGAAMPNLALARAEARRAERGFLAQPSRAS